MIYSVNICENNKDSSSNENVNDGSDFKKNIILFDSNHADVSESRIVCLQTKSIYKRKLRIGF